MKTLATVKHKGGSVMRCVVASGTETKHCIGRDISKCDTVSQDTGGRKRDCY